MNQSPATLLIRPVTGTPVCARTADVLALHTSRARAEFQTRTGAWRPACWACLQAELDAIAWLDGQGRPRGLPPMVPTVMLEGLDFPAHRVACPADLTVAALLAQPEEFRRGVSIEHRPMLAGSQR